MKFVVRFSRFFLLATTVLLLAPVYAQAGLTITAVATQSSISVGGSTDVSVYATSDSSDNIGQFNIAFDIKADSGNTTAPVASLEFIAPNAANDPTLSNSAYIYSASNANFSGDASFKTDTGQAFGTVADPGNIGYNTHIAGSDIYDGSDPNGYVTLTPGTTVLLADLVVAFSPQYTTNANGDLFDITLNLSGSNTAFGDGMGGAAAVSSPGTNGATLATVLVTSSQTMSTPEPATIWMGVLGGIVVAARGLNRQLMRYHVRR